MVASAGVGAQPYVVAGFCRDGAPNGAYELRAPDGRLRIAGAFEKGRLTGTFVFWSPSGARVAVIPYENGVKIGTAAAWYAPATPDGEPRHWFESAYSGGLLHGTTRSWHGNGLRRAEYRYERGVLAAAHAWATSGAPLSTAEARRLAERDRATYERFYDRLEQLIAENSPRCN